MTVNMIFGVRQNGSCAPAFRARLSQSCFLDWNRPLEELALASSQIRATQAVGSPTAANAAAAEPRP